MKVSEKTILVTGAGSGIGRSLTLALLSKNAKVVGVDLSMENLEGTKLACKEKSDRFFPFSLDISNMEKVMKLPEEVMEKAGPVDGIINNAGIIQPFVPIKDLSIEATKKVMDVNFYGTFYFIKAFLPHLLARPEAHIVNISSMGGFLPVPGQAVYGASKAAVKLMTEGLYSELKDTPVRVTVVFPGAVETNITKNSGLKTPEASAENSSFKALKPELAAAQIIDAMEKNAFRVCVGSDSSFLDKLYRFSPRYATDFIRKKMASLLNT